MRHGVSQYRHLAVPDVGAPRRDSDTGARRGMPEASRRSDALDIVPLAAARKNGKRAHRTSGAVEAAALDRSFISAEDTPAPRRA